MLRQRTMFSVSEDLSGTVCNLYDLKVIDP